MTDRIAPPPLHESIRLLKTTIHKAVDNALENFKRDTGLTPRAIEIRLIDTTRYGGAADFKVGEVNIVIEG